MPITDLRGLPSVEQLLQTRQAVELIDAHGRPLTLEAVRSVLAEAREAHADRQSLPEREDILTRAGEKLAGWTRPSLRPLINATGVILHTNLGRAPLSRAAAQAVQAAALEYNNLEFRLETGARGSRTDHIEDLLRRVTGAEAALVVNNNAAAVLLALSALAKRKRAIIARSQLVEIGGGFRIPDVMAQSGARLVETGTTNRVHISDYEAALEEPAALVLKAHPSNFRIIGFTSEPSLPDLTAVTHRAGALLVEDLGSGALLDTARYGLDHEPTVQESLAAGVDLVCFSGDKLLGGPQAGILVGKAGLIGKLKKHPLARAVRADKLCLAGLAATLIHYRKGEAEREIPVWRMISMAPDQIQARACRWADQLGHGNVIPGESTVGGGSLPGETLPTTLLSLDVRQPNRCLDTLRQSSPPVVARVLSDQVVLDPRTVFPEQDEMLLEILGQILR